MSAEYDNAVLEYQRNCLIVVGDLNHCSCMGFVDIDDDSRPGIAKLAKSSRPVENRSLVSRPPGNDMFAKTWNLPILHLAN